MRKKEGKVPPTDTTEQEHREVTITKIRKKKKACGTHLYLNDIKGMQLFYFLSLSFFRRSFETRTCPLVKTEAQRVRAVVEVTRENQEK